MLVGPRMLLLDSEALSAISGGPAQRRDRVRALAAQMRARNLPVATVAAVIAEVVRGHVRDAAIFAGISREAIQVHPVDLKVGVRAGQLLGSVGAASELAIDAFVVAAADIMGGAVVATVDASDLRRLAAHASRVVIADIS